MRQRRLSYAIGSVIAASLAGGASAAGAGIEEVVVTAQKRTESLQDTAIAVQAMDERRLGEQRVRTFDDYVALLPAASAGRAGIGMRESQVEGAGALAIVSSVRSRQRKPAGGS